MIRRTRIRKVSNKRAKEMKTYSLLREAFLLQFPICQWCTDREATEVHHVEKRGINYLNIDTWKALCHSCHKEVHDRPSWARRVGLLK